MDEIKITIEFALNSLITEIQNFNSKQYGYIIDDIIKYIHLYYKEDLTINRICEQFYINGSYFCKLFKTKTGTSFNDYLTELRVRKAKEILRHEHLKVF